MKEYFRVLGTLSSCLTSCTAREPHPNSELAEENGIGMLEDGSIVSMGLVAHAFPTVMNNIGSYRSISS